MMRRETMMDLLESKRAMLEAGDRPEDVEQYVTAVGNLFESHPELESDPALRRRAFQIDDALREAGDRRSYDARYGEIADVLAGTVDNAPDELVDALNSMEPSRMAAAVRFMRTGSPAAPAVDPEGPEHGDTRTEVGVMALSRAKAQVERHLAQRTADAMGVKV